MQRLNGRITALGRFIVKPAERCLPFFEVLKGQKKFKWTPEFSKAFTEMKEYLAKPPLLRSLRTGEKLYTYLTASDRAIATVLVANHEGIEYPIYYISKALTPLETRYFNAEKLALALVTAARKLRAYFSAHPIVVYTNAPCRKVLHKPDSSGRL